MFVITWCYKVVRTRYSFPRSRQNQRDLPRDIPLVSVEVHMYDIKRSKSKNKGKVVTKMELVSKQTQQGTSYEVLVCSEGVKELKRKVKIKGEKKEALLTLRQKLASQGYLDIGNLNPQINGLIEKIVTYWFTLTVLSALRRSGNPDGRSYWIKTSKDSKPHTHT
nr:hypothetical protein [Tanacetum cinerariifolium]